MSIITRVLGIVFIVILMGPGCIAAQEESDVSAVDVVHCENLTDVENAKQAGAVFFEFRNTFWVKVGLEYKGPFRYLRSAQKILNQHKLENMNKPEPEPSQNWQNQAASKQKPTSYYNPQLTLFPFIEYTPTRNAVFSIPGGQTVAASQVMIHPEPLEFENVSFGMIDLAMFVQRPPVPVQKQPNAQPPVSKPLEKYFAVTGEITARETVSMPTAPLQYSVGAAVLGKDGTLLWREYGSVDDDKSFKCIGRIPNTQLEPEFLLLFTLAKGKLATNIRPKPEFPVMDARLYDYHILCSTTLEMGPNWYPPVQKAAKEEYNKMIESMQREKIKKARSGGAKEQ